MANIKTSKYLGVMIFSIFLAASCERTKDKMYKSVNGTFCFKRMNATHEFGCTSARSGNTGVIHFIKNETDLTWLVQEADAGPYVVVVTFTYFNRDTLLKLKHSGKVSGVVLSQGNENATTPSYSPDDKCPNRYSGLEDTCDMRNPWNPVGDSLLFTNIGFPIIYIDSKEALDFIEKCYEEHNNHDRDQQKTRSLCSLELMSHMLAAVDTKTCIRRTMMFNNLFQVRYCDPLGDWSIFLPLIPRTKPEKERSVILVTARLDGFSLFDETVPGAQSPITGIVSLLTTAYYLTRMTNLSNSNTDKNVVFMLLNGESFDYIGSSRVIYEMKNGRFPYKPQAGAEATQMSPLQLNNIGLIVELDEITNSNLFSHSRLSGNSINDLGNAFLTDFKVEASSLNLNVMASGDRLPPASLQRFAREDSEIRGVVINSFNNTFSNRHYHSILDTRDDLPGYESGSLQTTIAKASLAVAKALYKLLFSTGTLSPVEPDVKMVKELLTCYLETPSCPLFQTVTFKQKLPEKPLSMYVGVHNHNNTITVLTGLALAWLTGVRDKSLNKSACHKDDDNWMYQRFWMLRDIDGDDGICIVSPINYTLALSPAFDIDGYKWESNSYSSWTESLWQQVSARVFLKPSKHHEISNLSLGLVVLIFSFVVVYFMNTKADILFNNQSKYKKSRKMYPHDSF